MQEKFLKESLSLIPTNRSTGSLSALKKAATVPSPPSAPFLLAIFLLLQPVIQLFIAVGVIGLVLSLG
jgi:hypothetical protein